MSDEEDVVESPVEGLRGTNFEPVADAHNVLKDATDDELIRLLYAQDRGDDLEKEADVEELIDSLASLGLANFTLEERGYTISGDPGQLVIRDSQGEVVAPDFVDIDC